MTKRPFYIWKAERKQQQKKRCGSHNCTQAVLCTYCDYTGLDEETIKHVGNSFAVGMGNMEGTCGAIVGAGVVLGLATRDKAKAVRGMRQLMDKFQQRNGATQCRLLKVWAEALSCANAPCAWRMLRSSSKNCWTGKDNTDGQIQGNQRARPLRGMRCVRVCVSQGSHHHLSRMLCRDRRGDMHRLRHL